MFSQLFILSLRGDILTFRDFRNTLPKETAHVFFRRVKVPEKGEPKELPIFHSDGVQYLHLQSSGMYFVLTSCDNVSPNLGLEILNRLIAIICDYCGVVTEEAIRKNLLMIYELIDEVIDFGYPQETTTEALTAFVTNSPVLTDQTNRSILSELVNNKTVSSRSANQSVAAQKKEDIYVDLFEHLNIIFDGQGHIVRAQVEGEIKIRSFLKGNPKIRLSMNEDLLIGKETAEGQINYGKAVLDYCVFHDCVQFAEWDIDRTLIFHPPDGSFTLMRYSLSDHFTPPFRLYPCVEEPGPGQLDVIIKLVTDFPDSSFANKICIIVPLPKATVSASCELDRTSNIEEMYEFDSVKKRILWKMKRLDGGIDTSKIIIRLNLDDVPGNHKREIGPISVNFEIPMYISSAIFIRALKIVEQKESNPSRWVRSITKSGSYVSRVDVSNVKKSTVW